MAGGPPLVAGGPAPPVAGGPPMMAGGPPPVAGVPPPVAGGPPPLPPADNLASLQRQRQMVIWQLRQINREIVRFTLVMIFSLFNHLSISYHFTIVQQCSKRQGQGPQQGREEEHN